MIFKMVIHNNLNESHKFNIWRWFIQISAETVRKEVRRKGVEEMRKTLTLP